LPASHPTQTEPAPDGRLDARVIQLTPRILDQRLVRRQHPFAIGDQRLLGLEVAAG
jgi:hypothetical protein